MLRTYICLQLSSDNEVGVQQSANVAGGNACSRVAAVKIPGSLNEMSTTMQLNALNNAPQFPVQSLKYLLIITCFWSPRCTCFLPHWILLPTNSTSTHRSVLLDLLVAGDDLPDAIDEATLVVGDEAHEYSLLGWVKQHQHPHFTGRGSVGEVDAASLQRVTGQIKTLTWDTVVIMWWAPAWGHNLLLSSFAQSNMPVL